MRIWRRIVVSALGLACATGLAAAEVPFETAEVHSQTVAREEVFDAVIEAVHQATVSAQTSGRITEIYFDVDDYVQKDSILLRFRDKEQKAALKAAEARFEEAQSTFSRVKDLIEKKLVSKSEFDKAEAGLKAARAALEQAQEQLEHTVVRAPYAGIVVARHVEPGEAANPGQPLMTGLSLEKLRAIANVPQGHIDTVRAQGRARVLLPTRATAVPAESLTFSPYADPQSHTFRVRLDLPAGQHGVYPGMFAKAAFVTGEEKRLLVPAKAVVHRSEVTAVYVVNSDGTVSFRLIRAGRTRGEEVEVLAGLDEGETVALDPIRAGVYLKEKKAGKGS